VNSISELPLEKPFNIAVKRVIDVIVSLLVMTLVLSWFMPIISLLIKLTSRGPVFFIQERSGKDNKGFNCIKFRSMYVNDDAHSQQAVTNDPRITLPGKFLRKFSLDELPQFFNVLVGDMSIIGPRPHMTYHTESYAQVVNVYMDRLDVKPGITGLAQVMGYRGEIKNTTMIANRVKLDIFYIKNWSMGLDLLIALKTIKLVLFG
jgi:putative colanic acid biosynthesis UDP-glucose lipid carrier transferase